MLANTIWFFVVIGIMVTIHEFGHFYVARRCGVKVLRFSIGFGPVLWRHIGADGTEYAISAIPLGGYVKMKGEVSLENEEQKGAGPLKDQEQSPSARSDTQDSDEYIDTDFAQLHYVHHGSTEPQEGSAPAQAGVGAKQRGGCTEDSDEGSFAALGVGKRALIVAAGPFANFVLAFVLYYACHLLGMQEVRPVVGVVSLNSPADAAEIKPYDLIESINGSPTLTWYECASDFVLGFGDKLTLSVSGDVGKEPPREVILDLSNVQMVDAVNPLELIGMDPCHGYMQNEIDQVMPDSAAQKAGLQKGDRILSVNGIKTPNWYQLLAVTGSINDAEAINAGRAQVQMLHLEVQRAGQILNISLLPERIVIHEGEDDTSPSYAVYVMGISGTIESIPDLFFTRQYGPLEAIGAAAKMTVDTSMLLLEGLKDLIVGSISVKMIGGPISIAEGAGMAAERGVSVFLTFLALVSVNLGVMNLIPLPILDGGQLVFCLYEKCVGRKPNLRVQVALTVLSISILVAITFLAIFNDMMRLF